MVHVLMVLISCAVSELQGALGGLVVLQTSKQHSRGQDEHRGCYRQASSTAMDRVDMGAAAPNYCALRAEPHATLHRVSSWVSASAGRTCALALELAARRDAPIVCKVHDDAFP